MPIRRLTRRVATPVDSSAKGEAQRDNVGRMKDRERDRRAVASLVGDDREWFCSKGGRAAQHRTEGINGTPGRSAVEDKHAGRTRREIIAAANVRHGTAEPEKQTTTVIGRGLCDAELERPGSDDLLAPRMRTISGQVGKTADAANRENGKRKRKRDAFPYSW